MPIFFDESDVVLPTALDTVPVQRSVQGQVADWQDDQVVAEVPVALVFNGISHAVMMCTPQDLPAMALGFALSEGIIDRAADCYDMELVTVAACAPAHAAAPVFTAPDLPAVEVRLEIASSAFMRLKEQRRSLAGRTGCGVCGIDNLQALDMLPPQQQRPAWLAQVDALTLFKAMAAMPAQQHLNKATGAVHAAGFASPEGELIAVYEDVGRHNALDKLLGARAQALAARASHPERALGLHGQPWPDEGFVVMSSRASYELVRKCSRLGIPLLATISAPTSLAIQVAKTAGLQLWGLVRAPRAVRYTL
ncbi:formate dehydrogenase accessory sulfurtransferase FdhD [Lampropedia aestuarii]|uniref:formate dehydrogenase accessory sulfurtransferase FdhD n=1 Tax=Lampropedia aestuarii TaxID=2562762 RepID=UPI00246922BF|nr:formate dehydrogenase accessory sulfurtransferase FdhD [Lampropedia aestuarii]MDH5857699.1 formate dehydrogenase accessory sulfurtransferase FdhD [Lampropedia aestuarii]